MTNVNQSRRSFIKKTATWTAVSSLPFTLSNVVHSRVQETEPVFVSIFLRGGADGLNICVPVGDPSYQTKRPDIAVTNTTAINDQGATPFFGVNNDFTGLSQLVEEGVLSFIQCCGSTAETRSHFDAMDIMDAADPNGNQRTGWLQRAMANLKTQETLSQYAAISMGLQTKPSFFGENSALAVGSVSQYLSMRSDVDKYRSALEIMHADSDDILTDATLAGLDGLSSFPQEIELGSDYNDGGLSKTLRDVAGLIKNVPGVRFVAVDLGGWDHHVDEPEAMARLGNELGSALSAFKKDLGSNHFNRTMVLCSTEFGRTVHQNGNYGTDHGRGSTMLAMGGALKNKGGGKVLLAPGGNQGIRADGTPAPEGWPGLEVAALDSGRYLPVTTDYRKVYAEVMSKHMGIQLSNETFPGLQNASSASVGLL